MTTKLEHIIATHRALAAADERYVGELLELARDAPPPRPFRHALEIEPSIAVIAEIKRRSPSAGELDLKLDPIALAKEYETSGASCLSVLTDNEFFSGSVEDLQNARNSVSLPVLRKDFTVCEADVVDARIMGADAVLLIVAALEDEELRRFSRLADRLGLDALFEVHDGAELERAIQAEALMIGVNQRNLHTFEIDYELAARLYERMPAGIVTVAESGIRNADDVRRVNDAGYDATLVGSSLVTAHNPGDALHELLNAGRR